MARGQARMVVMLGPNDQRLPHTAPPFITPLLIAPRGATLDRQLGGWRGGGLSKREGWRGRQKNYKKALYICLFIQHEYLANENLNR